MIVFARARTLYLNRGILINTFNTDYTITIKKTAVFCTKFVQSENFVETTKIGKFL